LSKKLADLLIEKERIVSELKSKGKVTINEGASLREKELAFENERVKQEIGELKLEVNNLKHVNGQLKLKNQELNTMVNEMTESQSSHENVKKLVDLSRQNEELSAQLFSQHELVRKLEKELDAKNQELEVLKNKDYSFAQGRQSFARQPGEDFPVETSSI